MSHDNNNDDNLLHDVWYGKSNEPAFHGCLSHWKCSRTFIKLLQGSWCLCSHPKGFACSQVLYQEDWHQFRPPSTDIHVPTLCIKLLHLDWCSIDDEITVNLSSLLFSVALADNSTTHHATGLLNSFQSRSYQVALQLHFCRVFSKIFPTDLGSLKMRSPNWHGGSWIRLIYPGHILIQLRWFRLIYSGYILAQLRWSSLIYIQAQLSWFRPSMYLSKLKWTNFYIWLFKSNLP